MTPFAQKDWTSRCSGAAKRQRARARGRGDRRGRLFVRHLRGRSGLAWRHDDPVWLERLGRSGRGGVCPRSRRRAGRQAATVALLAGAQVVCRCAGGPSVRLAVAERRAVSLAAAPSGSLVLAGCLRNARAVAEFAQQAGRTFNVIPSGERWRDGSMRPALEDALGAGAILRRQGHVHLRPRRPSQSSSAVVTTCS